MNRRSSRPGLRAIPPTLLAALVVACLPTAVSRASAAAPHFLQHVILSAQRASTPAAVSAPDTPTIQLTPNMVSVGQSVAVQGRNFCAAPCSLITMTLAGHVVASGVSVGRDGTFLARFTALAYPGLYTVTATQVTADGARRAASLRLNVTNIEHDTGSERSVAAPRRKAPRRLLVPGDSSTEFQPNIAWGGRAVAVDVSPASSAVAILASESGGLFETLDGGITWSHLNTLPAPTVTLCRRRYPTLL